MKQLNHFLIMLLVLVFGQSCSASYFGHTEEEWNKLTEEEQMIIKNDYQTVLDAQRNQPHTDKIKERLQSVVDYGRTLKKF